MNKFTKIFLRVMPIFLVVAIMVTSVYGIDPVDPSTIGKGDASKDVENLAATVWSTVVSVVQILAIAAIVIAGVRYMFASADSKADIKKQTLVLVVGAALVFAAVPIATFISSVATDLFPAAK